MYSSNQFMFLNKYLNIQHPYNYKIYYSSRTREKSQKEGKYNIFKKGNLEIKFHLLNNYLHTNLNLHSSKRFILLIYLYFHSFILIIHYLYIYIWKFIILIHDECLQSLNVYKKPSVENINLLFNTNKWDIINLTFEIN